MTLRARERRAQASFTTAYHTRSATSTTSSPIRATRR
jgi:hypothetical protein